MLMGKCGCRLLKVGKLGLINPRVEGGVKSRELINLGVEGRLAAPGGYGVSCIGSS